MQQSLAALPTGDWPAQVLPGHLSRALTLDVVRRAGRPRVQRCVAEPPQDFAQVARYATQVERLWAQPGPFDFRLLIPAWATRGSYGDHYRRLAGYGVQVRVLPAPQPQLWLYDGRLGAFNRRPHDLSALVVLRDPDALSALERLFDATWASAAPLAAASLDAETEELLRALAAGATDVAAARALRVSERTVRRRVRELMDEHGLGSRFQLGLQAAALLGDAAARSAGARGESQTPAQERDLA